MNHTINIVLFALFGVILFIDSFKEKKLYRLILIIPILFAIFFQTSYSNSISKPLTNILIGILSALVLFIFYLIIKDEKKNKKE